MKKTAIAAALLMSTGVVNADAISSITITGGDFGMGAPAPANCTQVSGFENYNCISATTTYNAGDVSTASVSMFNFFNAPVTTFLASSAAGAAGADAWGSGFQGDVDTVAGTISVNMGGFYANWSGTNFLQGTDTTQTEQCVDRNGTMVCGTSSAAATGTVDMEAGTFDISWSSFITTAPFAGQTGFWHLTGTFTSEASAVPVPAAVWLFGSGLVGLAGVARRRKAA